MKLIPSVDSVTKEFTSPAVVAAIKEVVRDTIGTALVAGSNVTLTVNDAGDTITVASSGGGALFADPNADRIAFWDDSAGAFAALTHSAPLSISGTTLSVSAATTSAQGIVELATTTEAATGTDSSRAVTPAGVAAYGDQGFVAVNTVAASGATETISGANQFHKVTMDQNCTFTFTSPTAGAAFALQLSGAFTPTFPASVDWPDGTPPTYSSPSLYGFYTFDGGTTWFGTQVGKAFA